MTDPRIVERAKKLSIQPVGDSLLRFRATLDDSYHSDEGDEGAEGDEIIHSIALEGTISVPDLVIRTITPISHKQPYPECAASLDPVRGLAGVRIGPGFRSKVMELMGRTKGCSHFLSLALDPCTAQSQPIEAPPSAAMACPVT